MLLKLEVVFWLVAGSTAFFSFSLPGLLLAAFGNIYIRDAFSLARGITVIWFMITAAPLLAEPNQAQKIVGTLGLLAALVIFFLSYTHMQKPRQAGLPVILYTALVAAASVFLLWTNFNLRSVSWIPAIIFLLLSVYSLLAEKS